tara:strand:- start:63 stop:3446 length:3384 start_codon:yes stop_codon:yes gene_type:complete
MPISQIKTDGIASDAVTQPKIADNITLDGTEFVKVPAGTTAQRPSSAAGGQLRFNTTLGTLEQYNTNTNAWAAIDSPPIISALAYSGSTTAADPAGGETITLTGSNFKSGFSVTVGGTSAASTTFVNSTTVRFTTPAKTAGDYDVTFTNSNGLAATLTNGISYNGLPAFSTSAGSLGSVVGGEAISTITVVAAEPDGGTLAFSITQNALPAGLSLGSANGQITGTPTAPASTTTTNFTITATDDEGQTNSRAFSLEVLRPVHPYNIPFSLKFNNETNTSLSKAWSGNATDGTRGTLSMWVKRGKIDADTSDHQYIIHSGTGSDNSGHMDIKFQSGNNIISIGRYSDTPFSGTASIPYRDTSGFYHIVVRWDTTSGTASDREVQVYVNGNRILGTQGAIGQNEVLPWTKNGNTLYVGKHGNVNRPFDGLMADLHVIDGQALLPTSFAEDFNGVWTPKAYSGTYGNNGFQLKFGTDTAFGDDTSGNNNDFTSAVLVAADQSPSTPTNVFASLEAKGKRGTNARGNFKHANTQFDPTDNWNTTNFPMVSTMVIPKDKKIYFEFTNNDGGAVNGTYFAVGVGAETAGPSSSNVGGGRTVTVYGREAWVNGTGVDYGASYGLGGLGVSSLQQGDILGVAVDGATRKVWFSRNGVFFKSPSTNNSGTTGDPANGLHEIGTVDTGAYGQDDLIAIGMNSSSCNLNMWNFGQDSTFNGVKTSGSANATDANGHGDFYYTPPTGYLALCSKNLTNDADMDIAKDEGPDKHFSILSWSGANNTNDRAITGVGFQPDLIWSKSNTIAYHHALFDSVRGPGSWLATDRREAANSTTGGGRLSSIDSDGFTWTAAGSQAQWYNTNGQDYLAWCWKAGGAPTATNSAGAGAVPTSGSVMIDGVASTAALAGTNPVNKLSANTKAGFSIVSYTGNTTNKTKAHGLGARPSFIITKKVDAAGGWVCWHDHLTSNATSVSNYIYMDSVTGTTQGSTSNYWTQLDTNVFGGWASGGDNNNAGTEFISYIWAEIPGFSKFGRYGGNANATGPFINTGFKPALVMIANLASNVIWYMIDNKIGNVGQNHRGNKFLTPSAANAQDTPTGVQFFQNGFQIVSTGTGQNQATSLIYMAWAENPYKFSTAK